MGARDQADLASGEPPCITAAQEVAEAERSWNDEIRSLKAAQRADYREFVIRNYKLYVEQAEGGTPALDGRARAESHASQHSTDAAPSPAADAPPTPAPAPQPTPAPAPAPASAPAQVPPAVAELVEMGFPAAQAQVALLLSDGRKVRSVFARRAHQGGLHGADGPGTHGAAAARAPQEHAVTLLLERPEQIEEMLQAQAAAAAANPPAPASTPAQAKLAALKAASASPKVPRRAGKPAVARELR